MSRAVIINSRLTSRDPAPTSNALDGLLLKGTWFQIARWGLHDDLFAGTAYAEWTLIPRDKSYFSVSLEVKYLNTIKLYEGYATLTDDGIFTPVLNVGEDVISLGDYLIRYTDYAQYLFSSAPGDLLVWSRYPYVRPMEVNIIIAKAESYDYSGAKLYVNKAAISSENTKSPILGILTPADAIPYSARRGSITAPRVNTKISLEEDVGEEYDFDVPNRVPEKHSTERHFDRGQVATVRR